jgi:SET domain-containing protein
LFAVKDISKDLVFGVSHIKDNRFKDEYIRTPLGGFVNHSNNPNCEFYIDGDYIKLRTLEDISKGNELTAKYWLYHMGE